MSEHKKTTRQECEEFLRKHITKPFRTPEEIEGFVEHWLEGPSDYLNCKYSWKTFSENERDGDWSECMGFLKRVFE